MRWLLSLAIILQFLSPDAYAQKEPDIKLRVTVTRIDGTSREYKLDWIDEQKIVVFERGTLEAVEMKRSEVSSLAFGEDHSRKFQPGEEGFVLQDGKMLRGHPTGMDTSTFWIVPEGSRKEERIEREKVAFIQFEKRASDKPVTGGIKPVVQGDSTELVLVAANAWEDTGLDVTAGQQIWFTVSDLETYSCGPEAPRVNADGKDPLVRDPRRPLPDVKHCALIARVGKGTQFRVGLSRTPFSAPQKGRLFVGLNDFDFQDNLGRLSVYIKTGTVK
jgi:hypothetical protein